MPSYVHRLFLAVGLTFFLIMSVAQRIASLWKLSSKPTLTNCGTWSRVRPPGGDVDGATLSLPVHAGVSAQPPSMPKKGTASIGRASAGPGAASSVPCFEGVPAQATTPLASVAIRTNDDLMARASHVPDGRFRSRSWTKNSGLERAALDDERDQLVAAAERDRDGGAGVAADVRDRAVDAELGDRGAVDRDHVVADHDAGRLGAAAGHHHRDAQRVAVGGQLHADADQLEGRLLAGAERRQRDRHRPDRGAVGRGHAGLDARVERVGADRDR